MLSSRCPYSTSRALTRVFLSGLSSTTNPKVSRALPIATIAQVSSTRHAIPITQITPFTIRSYAKLVRQAKPKTTRQVTNNDIPYAWVRIKQPKTSSSNDGYPEDSNQNNHSDLLGEPEMTDLVLRRLDLSKYALVMLAPPPPPQPGQKPAAICRIADLEAEERKEIEAKKEARQEKINTKELEFNWAIAKGDMDTKLDRLATFLKKGMRVEVLLAKKKGSRVASKAEQEALVQSIRDAVENVAGAKEMKKLDGTMGKVARLAFEGPGKKLREQIAQNEADAREKAIKAEEEARVARAAEKVATAVAAKAEESG